MENAPTDPRVATAIEALFAEIGGARDRLVDQAVGFIIEAHEGARRRSGEPFACHPLEVARICAQLKLSNQTVIAALLHDTIEDTETTRDQIEGQFGSEVARIVDGVTKIRSVAPLGSPQRSKVATYQKLILAAAADARVIVVKIADRLHNMRTIDAMPSDRARAIAVETRDVFAPIAHRLGMDVIQGEMNDLALRTLDPTAFAHASAIRVQALQTADDLRLMAARLTEVLSDLPSATVTVRVKEVFSIAAKLSRTDEMQDILGTRVICDTEDECYVVLGRVHRLWPPRPGTLDDYIAVPRSNLYQSLHTTVAGPHGQPVEVQIRTRRMHEVAENGIAAHWAYKERLSGGGPPSTRRFLASLAAAHEGTPTLEQTFDALRTETLADEIWVFTPNGDVRILPEGACAVDFAYSVHTHLGDRCVGARVDGHLRDVTSPLRRGQIVDIITGPDTARPPREWLDVVATPRARAQIRRLYAEDTRRDELGLGYQRIDGALRAHHLALNATSPDFLSVCVEAGYATADAAAVAASADDGSARHIARVAARRAAGAARTAGRTDDHHGGNDPSVAVADHRGVRIRLARCCSPEPGDDIGAYLSLEGDARIHRRDCPMLNTLFSERPARVVAATWVRSGGAFRCEMTLVFLARDGLLVDIAVRLASMGASLSEVSIRVDRGIARGRVACLASSPGQPELLREAIAAIAGALSVTRPGL